MLSFAPAMAALTAPIPEATFDSCAAGSTEFACGHGGFAVEGSCWVLSEAGSSCTEACGLESAVNLPATLEGSSSSRVVYCLEQLLDLSGKHGIYDGIDEPCSGMCKCSSRTHHCHALASDRPFHRTARSEPDPRALALRPWLLHLGLIHAHSPCAPGRCPAPAHRALALLPPVQHHPSRPWISHRVSMLSATSSATTATVCAATTVQPTLDAAARGPTESASSYSPTLAPAPPSPPAPAAC